MIIKQVAIAAVPVLVAITFHEAAHGYAAYRLGDPTAKNEGRLTLNPLAHIDPFGTIILPIMMLFFGGFMFGYAKPVPINPYNLRNPKRDMALTAAAGPATNLMLAIASVILMKLAFMLQGALPESIFVPVVLMLRSSVIINVVLAAFNLLPVPPLDGGRVLSGLLPDRQAYQLSKLEPYGMFIVIILLMTGLAGAIIHPLIQLFMTIVNIF